MGEQAKQDLELLRKARNEVQKLEEIHAKIMREEQEIREYEEEKQEEMECEKRYTCNEEDMKKEFLKENRKKRDDVQMTSMMIFFLILVTLAVVSFFVMNRGLTKEYGSTLWFWVGNFVILFILWCVPFAFSDLSDKKGEAE